MLKKYNQLFLSALIISDSLVILGSWAGAYYIRFQSGWIPLDPPVPSFSQYQTLLIPIWLLFLLNYKIVGLYKPLRGKSPWVDYYNIIKANSIAVLMLSALLFYFQEESFSRMVIGIFWLIATFFLVASHMVIRNVLMMFRRRGKNLRYILIAGAGELGQELVRRIDLHPEMGFSVVGYLTTHRKKVGRRIGKYPIVGTVDQVASCVLEHGVDKLFITLPMKAQEKIEEILFHLGEEPVDVMVVPDLFKFMSLSGGVDNFDGFPVVHLTESPLYGWNRVFKRMTDIVISFIAIVLTSPLMLMIALLVKLESRGPIFYVQERVGLDQKVFRMCKFRSMRIDAETQSGPVWTKENDDRRTRLGTLLRKTSLDELPQFFNVFWGDMSMVGPRPERPVFVEDFKKSVPHYMLRLKMKAGITGWAQVNGWRGNTSLEKRIEHDIYYIQHWSLFFDLKILIKTLWKGLINRHAY